MGDVLLHRLIGQPTMTSTPAEPSAGWLTPDQQAAWQGLLRMQAQLGARLSRQLTTDSGLSLQDYSVLVALDEAPKGRLRVHELGKELGWEKSRLSHHTTRMQARGLVERRPCPSDQRGLFITITRAGHDTLQAAAAAHVEEVRQAFIDRLSPEYITALNQIATAVLAGLDPSEDGQHGGEH
jgi:DNA-binding MarR family transcriptional regulator